MNKLLFLFFLLLTTPAQAAPTRFESSNYAIEAVIFGGTGVLRSSSSSIPPVITVGPIVTNITTTSATFSWTTDKESTTVVKIGTVTGDYPTLAGDVSSATKTSHSAQVTTLSKGKIYFYKVRSADVAGNVVESDEKTFTTDPGDITAPIITSGPSIATNSSTRATITWETNELSSTIVEYGTASVEEQLAGRLDELTTFHQVQVNGLLSSQEYLIRVKSKDSSGNQVIGSTQKLTTLSAPSITEVKIRDISLNSAVVEWKTTSQSSSIVSYGTTSGKYEQVIEDTSATLNHIVRLDNLASGTVFYLKIAGKDQAGVKLLSDEYTFKTVILPSITEAKISEITSTSAILTWNSTSEIDELIRYDLVKNAEGKVVSKRNTAGNEKLVSQHTMILAELDSGSEYIVTILGKDVFGNQAISQSLSFKTLPDSEPPVIENIKSDTSVDLGSRQTVQVLVSFGLSEPGLAYIEYDTGATGTYTQKVETDTEVSRNKFMVIPGLRPGESYHFRIVAKDRVGNTATSADYLVLAPAQPISLFDLIFSQVRQNFGWLSNL